MSFILLKIKTEVNTRSPVLNNMMEIVIGFHIKNACLIFLLCNFLKF